MYGYSQHTDAQAVILLSRGHVVFFERIMFSLKALIHFEKTLPLETKRSAGATPYAQGSSSRVLRQISISTACPAQQLPIVILPAGCSLYSEERAENPRVPLTEDAPSP